ncbi:Pepsin A [Durusdinium trenchii]|uniref:Pepsin A n=1 Tax=Durusdinium trenchii TaxID=1381693 RepID=A0ABP0SQV5_9DINO
MNGVFVLSSLVALTTSSLLEDVEPNQCIDLLQTQSEFRLRPRPVRQELANHEDVSYTGRIRVGQQDFEAILDTGSFELVIFTHNCEGCGAAGHRGYDPRKSPKYRAGRLVQELSYGSGNAFCSNAFDQVEIGSLHLESQPIWLVEQAQMKVLSDAKFQAILGVGPPFAMKLQAEMDEKQLQGLAGKLKAWNVSIPASLRSRMQNIKKADRAMENLHDSVPENLQLRFLSMCLGRKQGSLGAAIWHDHDPSSRPEPFRRLAVIGKVTWGLSLKNVRLVSKGQRIDIACSKGCGAILDTGTSLLTAPFDAVNRMGNVLKALGANCLKEDSLPHLEFELGGEVLSLPPQSYIGFVKGVMPAPWKTLFHQKPLIQVEDCQLLMMDNGGMTGGEEGPLWIIGMPFFRTFYTTFDYSSSQPSIWVTEASESCEPAQAAHAAHVKQSSLLQVDQSNLRLPRWMSNRSSEHVQL